MIDSTGNVIGRIGRGEKIVHFDSHLDTVQVADENDWDIPPFSGKIMDGKLWDGAASI
jgi:acetylornithine deacetylase/succinyl-diaminopimelate desuccinylase-like protein